MDFTKLKLVPYRVISEAKVETEQPTEPVKESRVRSSSFDINELVQKKELIHMRENNRVDWRAELEEEKGTEHPYVDVMPGGETEKDILKLLKGGKKKKVEESPQGEPQK